MASNIKGQHVSNTPRLTPPASLSEAAKTIFEHTINSVDASHFSAVDLPLLEAFSVNAALATQAAQRLEIEGAVVNDKASPWLAVSEKACKQLVALSARLRICPQSRFDRLSAGANSRQQPEMQIPEHIRSLIA